jgi:uncharacterized RDD family membrane protein YckC
VAANYASWGQRAGGYLIDIVPNIVVGLIAGAIHNFAVSGLFYLISLAWVIYNRWYLGGTTGQTWGRKLLNIRLVSEQTGQPIGMLMAFVRDICHIVDAIICYIGFLFPLWDSKRQTLADKILSTIVVNA